jgi:hypothetical protein
VNTSDGTTAGAANIEEATVVTDGCTPERAERVSRLIFNHLQGMLARHGQRPGAPRVVAHLQVPSLEVDWNAADDEAIAREGAAWVYRWLRTVI